MRDLFYAIDGIIMNLNIVEIFHELKQLGVWKKQQEYRKKYVNFVIFPKCQFRVDKPSQRGFSEQFKFRMTNFK